MKCIGYLLIALLLFGCSPEHNRIEAERVQVERELEPLPRLNIDTLVSTLGYLSQITLQEREGDHVSVHFMEEKAIDTVVLIPMNFLNNQNEYAPSGFPLRFKIEAHTAQNETILITDQTQSDFPSPGIAPVIFTTTDPRPVNRLTITVTKPSKGTEFVSNQLVFMLNELLVFSGAENVALNAEVHSEIARQIPMAFDPDYLVDGSYYFPPFATKEGQPWRNFRSRETSLQIRFDLGKVQTLNEARFYPNDFTPQFSNPHASAIGFPKEISLQVSRTPSFDNADPIIIADSKRPDSVSTAPLCRKFKPVTGRYVQISLKNGRHDPSNQNRLFREIISLSEIELLHQGVNQLSGIPFQTIRPLSITGTKGISPSTLTDGRSIAGTIVPEKEWLLQLARRAELEHRKAALEREQERLYTQQQKTVRLLIFSLPLLVLSFLLFLLGYRNLQNKKIQEVRERIADDLHDEVGATLTGIANATELLAEIRPASSNKEQQLLSGITRNARRTAKETRALIRFLEHKTADSKLTEQFKTTLDQMLLGIRFQTDFSAEAPFNALPPALKWDLLLLFKEALNNIIKHANADTVIIRTFRKNRKLILTITDNGTGLPQDSHPKHLIKRAKRMGAKLTFRTPPTGGTIIECVL